MQPIAEGVQPKETRFVNGATLATEDSAASMSTALPRHWRPGVLARGRQLSVALAAGVAALLATACGSEEAAAPPTVPAPDAIAAAAVDVAPVRPEFEAAEPPFVEPPVMFTLPAAGGGEVALADFLGRRPVVVVFYRGFF